MKQPMQKMRNGKPVVRFHVMAKPIGPLCNLNCTYCFYLHKKELLSTHSNWRMSDEVLERFIQQYIQQQNCASIVFSWQGGEPTLLGLDFYKKVIELEQKYAIPGVRIENDLQTNSLLLDDEWCEFLGANHFLVGLSIDGPKKLHDASRVYKDGRGSFDDVMRSAKRLQKYGVKFNTMTCVSAANARRPLDVYRFLTRELGSTRLQFTPVVEPKVFRNTAPRFWDEATLPVLGSDAARPGTPDSFVQDWCVDPDDWGYFMCKVFGDWYQRDVGRRWVYYFESALKQHLGHPADMCTLGPICGKGLAIEHNGDVYSCDHMVYPEYKLGNIMDISLSEMAFSPKQERFGMGKDSTLPTSCRECEFVWMCAGECPKNRFLKSADGEPGLNYLCSGWKTYFSHIKPALEELSKRFQ